MFRFIHSYLEEGWEGIVRQNLWRSGDGLKIMHKTYIDDDKRFNKRCAAGTPLNNLLNELKCPFYVDRVQGGIPMPCWYDYDPALLEYYKNLLGDNFWGFQMHEWASNLRNDADRVKKEIESFRESNPGVSDSVFWDERKKNALDNGMELFVEAFSVEEWEKIPYPENVSEYLKEVNMLWKRRKDCLRSPMFPADSYYMAPKTETANGAKILMPESGWQIPDMRIQIAYNRGMAKAAGIPFGTYYECWCNQDGERLTIPYSVDVSLNEWYEFGLLDEIAARTKNRNQDGGSSRSLQERAWLYSYFSGAEAIGEEYGVCNTFLDYKDFELSEYGLVKKRFLDFTVQYPDFGKTITPFAVALPEELEIFSLEYDDNYLGYPVSSLSGDLSSKIRNSRKAVWHLLSDTDSKLKRIGSESHVLQNGPYPDAFDIIHGDMTEAADKYSCIVDLTGSKAFADRYRDRIIPVEDIDGIIPKVLPVTVKEPVHYVVNKADACYYMLVINENGVDRLNYEGDRFLPEADIVSEILPGFLENPRYEKVCGTGELFTDGSRTDISLKAGQWLILRISE